MSLFADAPSVVAEFIVANKEFRQRFGNPVTFNMPQPPTWPGGTQINPDTNEPYDAMVQRINAPFASVVVVCLVVLKEASPLRPQSDVRFEPGGAFENMDVILDVDSDDYEGIADATEFTVNTLDYRVTEAKPFATGGIRYRWLIYGQER